jgi:hypothetical protein
VSVCVCVCVCARARAHAFDSFNKRKQVRIKMHGMKNSKTVNGVNTPTHLLQSGRYRQHSDHLHFSTSGRTDVFKHSDVPVLSATLLKLCKV